MNIIKVLALTLGAATIMAVSAACSNDSPPPPPNAPSVSTAPIVQIIPPDERQSTASRVQSISASGGGQQPTAQAVQTSPRLTTDQSTGLTVQPVSSGSMVPYPANVEDLIARGQIIVIGTLDEKFEEIMMGGYGADGQPSEGTMAFTDYQINIEEVIKGDDTVSAGTESVVLRMFGHKDVQKAVLTYVPYKLPEPGDHLLFALGRNPDGTYASGRGAGLKCDRAQVGQRGVIALERDRTLEEAAPHVAPAVALHRRTRLLDRAVLAELAVAREVFGVGCALLDGVRRLPEPEDVASAAALRAQPTTRLRRPRERAEEPIVVGHPVEDGVGEDNVDLLWQREIGEAGRDSDDVRDAARGEFLLEVRRHVR